MERWLEYFEELIKLDVGKLCLGIEERINDMEDIKLIEETGIA